MKAQRPLCTVREWSAFTGLSKDAVYRLAHAFLDGDRESGIPAMRTSPTRISIIVPRALAQLGLAPSGDN